MEQITLIKRNGTRIKLFNKEPFRTVKTATQSKSLMGVDTVTLSILSRDILSFDKGDRIVVNGENYYIRTKVNRELTPNGYFKYDAVFYGVLYDLMKTPYRNMDASGNSSTSTFDLVYDLKEYIRVLINNTQKDYPGWWVFDETGCPDKDPIPFQFSCNNCLAVLQQVCQKFKVDFRITQMENVRTIQIGHFGSNITPPDGSSYFEWGRGKGLYSLKENKVDDKAIKTRLWVEGGTSNLPTGYRDYAMRLQLPLRRKNKNAHTLSDGTVIEANSEYIGITSENARYIEDTALSNALGVDADSVLYDEIVPTRTGSVTAIYSSGENPDYLSFADSSMDFDINEHLVNNVSAKVTFITGKLAGQTLEISKYDATTKKFTLIPYQDSRGLTIPTEDSAAFRIGVGDRYKLTDIVMPQSVIDNAEEDLWYAGYDELCKLKQARVQYSMELNRMKLLEDMPTDSDTVLFKPGDYVPIKDTRFGVQKNIRIQKVERNLLIRHDYQLTISDTATIDMITQAVIDTQNHEVIIINNQLRDLSKMRRGWRTTEELRSMIFDPDGYFDMGNIRPQSVDTLMLTVGSKSQQFVLDGVVITPNYGGNGNRIVITAGKLLHLTIAENVREWTLTASDTTMGNTTGYYLYARCSKNGNTGVWLVTQTQYKADPEGDYYYFQVGIIGSYDSTAQFRDFTSTYGFTRINGNTITTGKIVTSDGGSYLDLDNNRFRMGDSLSSIDYNVSATNQITLNNVKLKIGNTTSTISAMAIKDSVAWADLVSSVQQTINSKANTSDLGTLALKSDVSWAELAYSLQTTINEKLTSVTWNNLVSDVQNTINAKLTSVSWDNLQSSVTSVINAKLTSVAWDNLQQSLQNTINSKYGVGDLGSLAFVNQVTAALLGETIITGGFLNTNYIQVNTIASTSGSIGGWTIHSHGLTSDTANGYFVCGDNSTHFLRINYSGAFLSVRNDTNQSESFDTAVSISAYGDGAVGLDVISQAGDGSLAIKSTGDVSFNVRSGEFFRVKGDGYIVLEGAVKTSSFSLPSNPKKGMIFFCKSASSSDMYVYGTVIKSDTRGSVTNMNIYDDSHIIVYDGSNWIDYDCH